MKRTILLALLLLLSAQAQNVKKQNRLAKEKSPYLRQHGSNPVDWYPWGKEALDRAKKEGKPIFLSIGYSSCHWCHVMEHESFDDLEVAKMLNKYFVCIKVDREERPDIDAIYMKAVTEVMGVQGGWPLSVWLTPDAKPFFGRTYFPKKAFLEINQRIADVWADPKKRKDIESDGDAVAARLKLVYAASEAGDLPPTLLKDARLAAERASDREQGGWGGRAQAPKFPNPGAIELLLRYGMRHDDSSAIATANLVLTKMARGGIHDHVGGGFHRYSTTRDWLVPHFEKMLYDNAQLLPLYAWAYRVTGKEIYRETALDVARWVQREMTGEHGAFFSAQDADDPGGPEGEGGFYIWDPAEIRKLLGKDAAEQFLKNYDVTDKGNWSHRPGKSILQLRAGGKTIAASLATLYPVREKRPKPFTDTKVLSGWNGLMISGFCRSFQLLGEQSHLESAVKAGNFVVEHMMADGKLLRRWADGSAGHDGVLDDYAWVVSAWLDLYESTFDEAWLSRAIALQQKADELFFDSAGGGYFYTSKDGEKLIARGKDAFDHARPAGNAVMAMNLLRLMHFTGDLSYKERANRTFKAFGDTAGRATFYFGALLNAFDFAADDTREIFIADGEGFDAMVEAVWRSPNRNRVLVKVTPAIQKLLDPAKGKDAVDGKAAAYVCRNFTCLAPVVDAALIDLKFAAEKKD